VVRLKWFPIEYIALSTEAIGWAKIVMLNENDNQNTLTNDCLVSKRLNIFELGRHSIRLWDLVPPCDRDRG
jgi:hypothetical protein